MSRQLRRRAHQVLGPGRSASASRQRLQRPGRGRGSTAKEAQDGDQVSPGKMNRSRLNHGGVVRLNWRSTSWPYRASGLTKGRRPTLGAGWLRGSPTGSCVSTCPRGPISPCYPPDDLRAIEDSLHVCHGRGLDSRLPRKNTLRLLRPPLETAPDEQI